MFLCPQSGAYIPAATAQVARAAFPKGNLSLPLRDARAMMYAERVFADLFLRRGRRPPLRGASHSSRSCRVRQTSRIDRLRTPCGA